MKDRRKTIIVSFDEKGDPTFEGENFTGNECVHEMKPFEEAIGDVGERQMKTGRSATTKETEKKKEVQ